MFPIEKNLSEEIKSQAIAAASEFKEAVGLVSQCATRELTNCHPNPSDGFLINPKELAEFERSRIQLIYHSHWREDQSGELSPNDCWLAHHYGLPILLYHTVFDCWDYYEPKNPDPWPLKPIDVPGRDGINFFLGWRSQLQRSDCFSLVYRYFLRQLNVNINEWQRPELNPLADFPPSGFISPWRAEDNGFILLPKGTPPQEHDIFGIASKGGKEYSHAAVLVDAEWNFILHTPHFKYVSQRVEFGDYWRSRAIAHGRHKSLI